MVVTAAIASPGETMTAAIASTARTTAAMVAAMAGTIGAVVATATTGLTRRRRWTELATSIRATALMGRASRVRTAVPTRSGVKSGLAVTSLSGSAVRKLTSSWLDEKRRRSWRRVPRAASPTRRPAGGLRRRRVGRMPLADFGSRPPLQTAAEFRSRGHPEAAASIRAIAGGMASGVEPWAGRTRGRHRSSASAPRSSWRGRRWAIRR